MTREDGSLSIDLVAAIPLIAILAGLGLISWQLWKDNSDSPSAGLGLGALLDRLGLPKGVTFLGFTLWATLFVTLALGVFFAVLTALYALPQAVDEDGFTLLRGALLTIAAITATLGAVVALPFTLIRVRTTERQTRTQEEGYVTQQINEAVKNLAQTREVKRPSRILSYELDGENIAVTERIDRRETPPEGAENVQYENDWTERSFDDPNIEVRIGAILALERLARSRAEEATKDRKAALEDERQTLRVPVAWEDADPLWETLRKRHRHRSDDGILDHPGARDHVRIMEILCAYVRENAPAARARPLLLTTWEAFTADKQVNAETGTTFRQTLEEEIRDWNQSHPGPRSDIQTALRVLGRRTKDQRACEGAEAMETYTSQKIARARWHGHRLDLRRTDLQNADLSHSADRPMRLAHADLSFARMEGANLWRARMTGALLNWAQLMQANLREAQMVGANVSHTNMEAANLSFAKMTEAVLWNTRMAGTDLTGTQFFTHQFNPTTMKGAGLKALDPSMRPIADQFLAQVFGDASAELPGRWEAGEPPLEHWFTEDLNYEPWDEANSPFHIEWRKFQARQAGQGD